MSDLCRICAKPHLATNAINLFHKYAKSKQIVGQLRKITGLELKKRKDMPELMCEDCQLNLMQAYNFRLNCKRAQTVLRTAHNLEKNIAKDRDSDFQDGLSSEKNYVNSAVSVKKEQEHDVLPLAAVVVPNAAIRETELMPETKIKYNLRVKESAKLFHEDENSIGIEELKQCVEFDDEYQSKCEINAFQDISLDSNEKEKAKVKSRRGRKKQNTSNSAIHVKDVPTQTSKAQNSTKTDEQNVPDDTDEKPVAKYICEMCGQSFTVQHYFMSHVNRHKGQQTFVCEICPAKYYSQQSLKRHMLKHAGALPNACRYCPRRFLDCSARVRHERMHTNDRPYKCTHCEKSFTTNYVLKNHILIHTGERSFNCKICQRSFIQKKHLATHFKSIFHKQNEEKANVEVLTK